MTDGTGEVSEQSGIANPTTTDASYMPASGTKTTIIIAELGA